MSWKTVFICTCQFIQPFNLCKFLSAILNSLREGSTLFLLLCDYSRPQGRRRLRPGRGPERGLQRRPAGAGAAQRPERGPVLPRCRPGAAEAQEPRGCKRPRPQHAAPSKGSPHPPRGACCSSGTRPELDEPAREGRSLPSGQCPGSRGPEVSPASPRAAARSEESFRQRPAGPAVAAHTRDALSLQPDLAK